jgi:hypothetical protein
MEKDLWDTFKKHLSTEGDFERIENMVGIGRPDVNYCVRGCEGNLELKQLPEWPKRGGVVKVDHYTPQQRNWAKRRLAAGGIVWVLLQIKTPCAYYLLRASWALLHLGIDATADDIYSNATVVGERRFPKEDILKCLTRK